MNDLVDFFRQQSRKQSRGPHKTICTLKGPAVTNGTYFIKRTIPLCIIAANHTGPAVIFCDKPANDNPTQDTV